VLHEITKKFPNGKIIRINIDADEKINSAKITGDFFLSPEETIGNIEKALSGAPKGVSYITLTEIIHGVLSENRASFIGIMPEDIAAAIAEALGPEPQ
jgi:lipoate---protein ligase